MVPFIGVVSFIGMALIHLWEQGGSWNISGEYLKVRASFEDLAPIYCTAFSLAGSR